MLISALTLAGSLATLAIPWLAGQLIGGVLDESDWQMERVITLLLAALVAMTGLNIAAAIISARISGQVLADLRSEAYAHVQRLPMAFHDRHRDGDILALMTYEVASLSQFLTSTLATTPSAVLTAAGAMALLFVIDPLMALFIPLLLPAFFIVLKLVGRRLRKLAASVREAGAEMMSAAEEDLEMLPATKAFAVEQMQEEKYARLTEEVRVLELAQERINAALAPAVALVSALAAIAIIVVAGDAIGERKSAAELFAFLLYAALLTRPMGALADFYGRFQAARGTLARLDTVLGTPPEPGYDQVRPIERARGAVAFCDVHFAYPGRDGPLHGADFSVAQGEIVALTGANGAGKSTLINLLLRYYQPKSGAILLDGQDIAQLKVQGLRRQFGLVPQRALLFNASVRDNIAFGAPGASDAEVIAAAELAQATAFINALPQGLTTQIGDHGTQLSGGQRQRIALARALLLDPPILIFDEATSMYDMAGEEAFVAACQTALKDRTVLIVTHRPASLALADRVIEIADGKAREVKA